MRYLQGTNAGTLVAGTGTNGIRYIYVDSHQNIYVSDTYNGRVIRWSNGSSAGVIVAGNGTYGTSLNQLGYPYGLWVDSSSNVYVAEYQIHRVTKWAPNATAGVVVAGITSSSGMLNEEILKLSFMRKVLLNMK